MPNNPKNIQLILIDGSSFFYRAFHALPSLATSYGAPTGAIYGFTNMLRKLISDYNPEHIAVIFDAKGKNFRHEIYTEYKANRPPMPSDLELQIKPLHELIKAMGLPLIVIEGVEADDVIATLALQAEQQGLQTLIASGDKDLSQLVSDRIQIIDTMSDKFFDISGVKKKFGISPNQLVDYLALIGDASDNIPGIPKVGPKTAVRLINQYGSIEQILNHVDEIEGTIGENLRTHQPQLLKSKQLVILKSDVELGFGPKDLNCSTPDQQKLITILKNLEFQKWLAEVSSTSQFSEPEELEHHLILTNQELQTLIEKLNSSTSFSFSIEVSIPNSIQTKIIGISFALKSKETFYIPLTHIYIGAPEQLIKDNVLIKLKPLFESTKIIKIGYNLKQDIEILSMLGINLKEPIFDIMLASYVLNSSSSKHDLATIAIQNLGLQTISLESLLGSGKKKLTFAELDVLIASKYSNQKSDLILQLYGKLQSKLNADPNVNKVFQNIEMPLLYVLAHLELNGVCIDTKLLKLLSDEFGGKLDLLEQHAFKLAESVFNLSSPKQMQEILFTKLNIPIIKHTPGGQPSTAEDVLQELAKNYELPKIILEYRSLSKLKSTYIDALPEQINPLTNRVHTTYNQSITTTGRLSSSNPNLQNIPIRTKEGKRIRQAFIAPLSKKIMAFDYSQIELRIMAHLSKDDNLLKAFHNNADIHRATAAEIFGIGLSDVTDEQRHKAKAINFGLLYGMSTFGLTKQLGISHTEAQQYMDIYFHRYPKIKIYLNEVKSFAKNNGYVETIFGRKIYTPDINSNNMPRRSAAERAAINAPLQGSAADIIKIAMINIDNWIQTSNLDIKMIMQVHDELVFEVVDNLVSRASPIIEKFMTSAATLSVDIQVDIEVGNNWGFADHLSF